MLCVTLLALSVGAGVADAVAQGYLAMYNVSYSNYTLAGEVEGINISFDFDQWIFDYDPATQTSTPHVFHDLKVNVTFPVTRNNGSSIFITGAPQPSFVVIDHDVSLGDVSAGIYHYELDIDLPAAPFYCVDLALPPAYREYLSTETTFCTPAEMPDDGPSDSDDSIVGELEGIAISLDQWILYIYQWPKPLNMR